MKRILGSLVLAVAFASSAFADEVEIDVNAEVAERASILTRGAGVLTALEVLEQQGAADGAIQCVSINVTGNASAGIDLSHESYDAGSCLVRGAGLPASDTACSSEDPENKLSFESGLAVLSQVGETIPQFSAILTARFNSDAQNPSDLEMENVSAEDGSDFHACARVTEGSIGKNPGTFHSKITVSSTDL
jgi:hypothetical protein